MTIRKITAADDAAIAAIIRTSLEFHGLALPGTAYFDPELDHLSRFYEAAPKRSYFVLVEEDGTVVGGIGTAEFTGQPEYAELQKLYLADVAQGQGRSYGLIDEVCRFAREAGYGHIYLETYHTLEAAIHVYERAGFTRLSKPLAGSQHGAMDVFFMKTLQ